MRITVTAKLGSILSIKEIQDFEDLIARLGSDAIELSNDNTSDLRENAVLLGVDEGTPEGSA